MYTRFPYGTSAENDQLLLPNGMLSVDIERKAIRLHDGATQGGFEMLGERAFQTPFRGEVSSDDLISGDALAALIGLTAGNTQNSDAGWLHFVDPVDQKTKYIAKRNFRNNISWDHINAVNAVTGTLIITIQDKQYRIRLLRGANSDPAGATPDTGYDTIQTHGSEWNRLVYPIVSEGVANDKFDSVPGAPGNWAQYNPQEAGLNITTGNGRFSWCQEVIGGQPTRRVRRGGAGVSHFISTASSTTGTASGWRPVLELVE